MKRQDLIAIRPGCPDDYNFILSTWLRSTWYAKTNATTLKKPTYFKAKHAEIDKLLRASVVLVAAAKDDPDVIYGYGVFGESGPVWLYVKKEWRNAGIATALKDFFKTQGVVNETSEVSSHQ